MKIDWKSPRKREDLPIPEAYLRKDRDTQNRREFTFILQEAAFSRHVPLYCTIDCEMLPAEERRRFSCGEFEVRAAILLGIHVREMMLFMEQDVPERGGLRGETMAELKVKNFLLEFEEKLAIQGYRTSLVPPSVIPDPDLAAMLAASKKGFAGKNGRFVTPDCGCRVCIGVILTDAPLMGGDYRYADYGGPGCGDCTLCLEACPAGALSETGFSRETCVAYREKAENQIEVAAHSRIKCMRCLEACPIQGS